MSQTKLKASETQEQPCIYCDGRAAHPRLPLCIQCDLQRLRFGITADQVFSDWARYNERHGKPLPEKRS